MQKKVAEKILFWTVRLCAYALPFTLLIVADPLFFPYVSGKGFAFRILVEVMAAAWVGLLILDFRKYWPSWNMLSAAFTLFVATMFIAAFFGVNFSQSFWSNFERMDGIITQLHLLALFLILAGTFRSRKEWNTLFSFSIFVSVLVAGYGILEYFGAIHLTVDSSRIISTLGNPLYVAAYLSFHIFLMASLFSEVKSTALKWFLGAAFLIDLIAFVLTGARGAFLGIIAGAGIVLLLSIFTSGSKKKKIIFTGAVVALLLVPVLLHVFRDNSFIKNNDILSRYSNITLQSGETRLTLWNMAIESFKERPVLGWGSENFIIPFAKHYDPKMFYQEPWFDRAHNMPLEWLVDGGIIGFSAYLFLLAATVWAIRRGATRGIFQKRQSFIFFGMLVAYVVQLLFVFDTLATYLTFAFMASFFMTASSSDTWLVQDSRDNKTHRQGKIQEQQQKVSISRSIGIGVAFLLISVLIVTINVRPLLANESLMNALILFDQGKFAESLDSFKKTLQLSQGTIGTVEARENLAFNMYKLFSSPDLFKQPGAEDLYQLTQTELEKQVKGDSKEYLNIKHNILLAQLYHQRALLHQDSAILTNAFQQYDTAIQFAPNYVSVYPIVANLYAQTGNMSKAVSLIEKAGQILTDAGMYDARTFYSKPLFFVAMKRYDDAYATLVEISQKYGNQTSDGVLDAQMMQNIIEEAGSQGRDTIPFLERIYGLDKKLIATPLMLAQTYASLGEKAKARFYASEALKIDPTIQSRVDSFLQALVSEKSVLQ